MRFGRARLTRETRRGLRQPPNCLLQWMALTRRWSQRRAGRWTAATVRIHGQLCQNNYMKQHMSTRFFGSCVIAGILLSVILAGAVDLLRPDYNPNRNLLDESLVGPLSFFMRAAACALAATFLVVLVGLWRNLHRSGFLVASYVLIGVVVISLFVSALFPPDIWPPAGSHPALTALIHLVAAARFYALLIALLVTLPIAFKHDEKWRSLSHVTLFLGVLTLASQVGFILAPVSLRGLVERGSGVVILAWLLFAGLHLRQTTRSTHGTPA